MSSSISALKMLLLFLALSTNTQAGELLDKWKLVPKQDKVLYTNAAVGALIFAWGAYKWDYFQQAPKLHSEGWFGANTREGGADKLGHLWSAYAGAHALGALYRHIGYDDREAGTLGALSSLGLTTLMEVGDAFSHKYGFSYEDQIMNTVGAGLGYLLWTQPKVARWVDLRVEWKPNGQVSDIFTDYEHLKYLVAIKLDAAESLKNSPLRFAELHAGYYARGYSSSQKKGRERNLYVGVGLNLSRIFTEFGHPKVGKAFNYIQVPYTYVSARRAFKN